MNETSADNLEMYHTCGMFSYIEACRIDFEYI